MSPEATVPASSYRAAVSFNVFASPAQLHHGRIDDPGLEALLPEGMRASLGGMQLKFTMSGTPKKLTFGTNEGKDQWILKLNTTPEFRTLPFNEAAVMRWCGAAGFDVPEVHVVVRDELPSLDALPPSIRHGFLVRRYDRTPVGRIHQEDFAQIFGCRPTDKYDRTSSFGLGHAASMILGRRGLEEFVRRLVVVVATANADAHLKNWSVLYPDGRLATWSPLYDQVCTAEYTHLDLAPAFSIGNAKHFHQVEQENFCALEQRWRQNHAPSIEVLPLINETLDRLRQTFDPEALGMQPTLADRLRKHWRSVPLLRSRPL